MAVPVSGMTPARRERNGNKHKRLFMGGPGGLTVCCLTAELSPCQTVASLPTCCLNAKLLPYCQPVDISQLSLAHSADGKRE